MSPNGQQHVSSNLGLILQGIEGHVPQCPVIGDATDAPVLLLPSRPFNRVILILIFNTQHRVSGIRSRPAYPVSVSAFQL